MKPKLDPTVIQLKTAYEIAFSPVDSRVAFIGGRDVSVLDIETRKTLLSVHPIANPSQIDFSPDGNLLAVKGTSGRTIILDAKNGQLLSDFQNAKEGEGGAALFSPCGRFLVSVSWNGLFSVRDWATGKISFSKQDATECQLDRICTSADRTLYAYIINHPPRQSDGPTPSTVVLRRASQIEDETTLSKEWVSIWGLQLSPSGRLLAVVSGTSKNALQIVEIATMQIIATGDWIGSPSCSIAWSLQEDTLFINAVGHFLEYAVPSLTLKRRLSVEYPCHVSLSSRQDYIAFGSWKNSFIVPMAYLDEFKTNVDAKNIRTRTKKQ